MNIKAKFKSGLSFGIAMATLFILDGLFAQDDLTTKRVVIIILSACLGGAVAGLLFGWLIGVFTTSKFVTNTTKIDVDSDENILFETGANHFKGVEGVGGKLYLTNKRLVFKSHRLNIQNHLLSINSDDIKDVDSYKTLGLLNNGLSITTLSEKTEKFVVEKVEEWVKLLKEKNDLQQGVVQSAG